MSDDLQMTVDRPGADAVAEEDGTSAVRQYVTFHLDADCYAFPMERVLEIIRMPRIVGVPLASRDVLGLANLRGAILPVRDLRVILGLPPRRADELSRTIVIDCGEPVGLVVDRVARVIGLPDSQIDAPDETDVLGDVVQQGILQGVAKSAGDLPMVQILDPVAALSSADAQVARHLAQGTSSAAAAARTGDGGAHDDKTRQIVCIALDGQEYAFDISEVAEIVRPPETIFRVPMAAGHVLGVIDLRARLLPVLGLRRLLRLPDLEISGANRIVVLRTGLSATDAQSVGVVVDSVREVLEVPLSTIVTTAGIAHDDTIPTVGTMCRLDDGRRLIGMLSVRTLLGSDGLRAEVRASLADARPDGEARDGRDASGRDAPRTDAAMDGQVAVDDAGTDGEGPDAMTDGTSETGETQLVIFQLGEQEFGVGVANVLEIIRVPPQLVRVPRAPACVAGVINLRGAILPVVSLREVFGVSGTVSGDRARIVVLSIGGTAIGYIVDAVTEVLRLPVSALEPPARLAGSEARLIGQMARLNGGERLVQIVEPGALPGAEMVEAATEALAQDDESAPVPKARARGSRAGRSRAGMSAQPDAPAV